MPKNKKKKGQSRPMKREKSSLVGKATLSHQWIMGTQPFPMFNNTLKRDNTVHRFIQFVDKGVYQNLSTSISNFGAMSFTFGDLGQVASFQNIFDQYRIDEIELWAFIPTNAQLTSTNSNVSTMFYSVVDYDDANVPSSFAALQQYTNVNVSTLNSGRYVRFKPHTAISNPTSGNFNVRGMWIDSNSSATPHFGFKYGIPAVPQSGSTLNYWVRYHFSCRNVF